jgi:hypothetical protein
MKIVGWCRLHEYMVSQAKFNTQCRSALGGKRCKEFTYKVPSWKEDARKKVEAQGGFASSTNRRRKGEV